MNQTINIPLVPANKIDGAIIKRVELFEQLVATSENKIEARQQIEAAIGMPTATQHWYCTRLRKLFGLEKRMPLSSIAKHPQLRQALEYLFARKERTDKATLTSAKGLFIIVPSTGEQISVEAFLKSLYPREGVNASSCYLTLKAACLKKRIVHEDLSQVVFEELPSERTVRAFLKQWRDEFVAVRRGRARKHDFETGQQPFVTRDVTQYRPGELWIGDHTELDFMVLNEQGKPDRRWISAFIDIRTGLLVGYHASWQPTSQTIAMAFRNGVLGSQLKAFTGERFEHVQISNIPEEVMMDNGKDYRSKYTQRVFGKIDFDDAARISVQRITRLHYTLPYHGQSKAQMERWFKTIQGMMKYLPGFKGNKYQNKPDTLSADQKTGSLLTVEQFDTMLATAVNSYNNRVHRTLKDQTPIQCYLTNQSHQRSIDQRVLDFLMLKAQGRRIRRCQVTMFGQEYYSEALMAFNDQLADVYYDPNDLGFISLYVEGQFAAVASNKEMIGRDERGWQKILRDRKTGEKGMQEELKQYRQGISDRDARTLLLEGELLNMTAVPSELLKRNTPTIAFVTGLEDQAKENEEELVREKRNAEIKEKAKKRAKSDSLSLVAVGKIQ